VTKDKTIRRYVQEEGHTDEPVQTLRGSDLVVDTPQRRRIVSAKPRVEASTAPHLDQIAADLYTVLLQESARLVDKARVPEGLDPTQHLILQKLVDGYSKLAKVQMEREKASVAMHEKMSPQDLLASLKEQVELLESVVEPE
jgi:hypothetical protein